MELERRGWSRSEAARRGGISASMMDKVIEGYSGAGMKFYRGLAAAFGVSLLEVLQRAGEYDPAGQDDLDAIFHQLSPEDQAELLEIANLKLDRKKKAEEAAARALRTHNKTS